MDELARLQVYVVLHSALALLLSLWILPGLIALLTPLRYGDVLRAFRGPLVTAFATANLLIVLPVLAADGKRLLAEADPCSPSPVGEGLGERASTIRSGPWDGRPSAARRCH